MTFQTGAGLVVAGVVGADDRAGEARERSAVMGSTSGVPYSRQLGGNVVPQPIPRRRSAAVQLRVGGSGSSTRSAPVVTSIRLPPGSKPYRKKLRPIVCWAGGTSIGDPLVDEDVGGAQHLLARVDPERDVVQPAVGARGSRV